MVVALHFWVEEGGRGHGMLDAFHFVGGIRNQSGCDGVVALLDSTGACNSHIQHGPFIHTVPFIGQLQGCQLLGFPPGA